VRELLQSVGRRTLEQSVTACQLIQVKTQDLTDIGKMLTFKLAKQLHRGVI